MDWNRLAFFLGSFSLNFSATCGGISDADLYVNNSKIQYEQSMATLSRLNIGSSESILDIGCGDGRITAAIGERAPKGIVVGLDPSRGMIDWALRKNSRNNTAYICKNAEAIAFSKQFDKVVSFNTLNWIQDHKKLTYKIYNALKTRGLAVLLFYLQSSSNVDTTLRRVAAKQNLEIRGPKKVYPTEESCKKLLISEGFKVKSFQVSDIKMSFSNREGLFNWVLPLVKDQTSHLSRKEQLELVDQVVERLIEKSPLKDSRDQKVSLLIKQALVLAQRD